MLNITVESVKRECSSPACQEKDLTINSLKKHVSQLELKLEESEAKFEAKIEGTEAYERRDTLIISGSVPPAATSEATSKVVVQLVKKKFPEIQIEKSDISVSHRLQSKRPNRQGVIPPPNIYVKLVRRDLKRELIEASRKQPRDSHDKIFINESLTPKRTRIRSTLLNMKKAHGNIIRGVSSYEGDVYAYTPQQLEPGSSRDADAQRRRDKRHRINTDEDLKKFCLDYIKKPLDEFLDVWQRN